MDISTAWMNGKSLAKALKTTKARHTFGRFRPKQRVSLDVGNNLYALGVELEHAFPFVVDTNLFVTAHDLDSRSKVLVFGNIRLTQRALQSALAEVTDGAREKEREAEKLGRDLPSANPADVLAFSEAVCDWGDGQRVWANLNRHYPDSAQLAREMTDWLSPAISSGYADAIAPASGIKGLGVSFASKHLRMLEPTKFATLDYVLHQGLGYALNPAGYSLFMRDITRIRDSHSKETRIADLEMAIFGLTRQLVRSTDAPTPLVDASVQSAS